jgi:hypothetical protein
MSTVTVGEALVDGPKRVEFVQECHKIRDFLMAEMISHVKLGRANQETAKDAVAEIMRSGLYTAMLHAPTAYTPIGLVTELLSTTHVMESYPIGGPGKSFESIIKGAILDDKLRN